MHDYNEQLLRLEPDIVVAFKDPFDEAWASDTCIAGTEHMCRIARQAGLPVYLNGLHRLVATGLAGGSAGPPPSPLSQRRDTFGCMEPHPHDTAAQADPGDVVDAESLTEDRPVRIIPENLVPDGVTDRISPEELEQRRLRALGK